jgi:hypothetical protein
MKSQIRQINLSVQISGFPIEVRCERDALLVTGALSHQYALLTMERILHVIDTLGVGGAERLLLSNITHLPEFKHQVVTLFPRKDNMVLPDDVPHICLGAQRITDLPFKRKQFQNIVKEYDPDFIHAHLYFSTIFSKWLTPPVIPYVFTQHSEFSKNAGRWYYRLADKLVSTHKHHCIAVSRSVLKDYLNSTAFKGDTRVIGN